MKVLEDFKLELQKHQKIAQEIADDELSKLRSNADKKIRDVEKRLSNLESDGKEFEEKIVDESNAMDKYSQKIYEQIEATIKGVQRPENITHKSLTNYVESLRNALAEQDKVLIKYVKLLKGSKYRGRVRSVDKAIKKLNSDLSSLEDFIKTEYGPASGVEAASDNIDVMYGLIDTYVEKYEELLTHEEEVLAKQKELDKAKEEVERLKNHELKQKYSEARDTYETVQREIDFEFSNIRKVFRKYDKYASKNRKTYDSALLSELVTDAANALAHQSGTMGVEGLLKEINEALEDTALNLARDKRETAKEDIERFLNGELKEYYEKSSSVVKEKERLEKELEDLDLDNKISTAERDLAAAERDTKRIYRRNLRSLMDTVDELKKLGDDVTTKMNRISSSNVVIEVEFPDLPDWIEIEE